MVFQDLDGVAGGEGLSLHQLSCVGEGEDARVPARPQQSEVFGLLAVVVNPDVAGQVAALDGEEKGGFAPEGRVMASKAFARA